MSNNNSKENDSSTNEINKISSKKNIGENSATKNYINNSNIINENSSDNDIENSNLDDDLIDFHNKEFKRLTKEYIKVLSLYQKGKIGQKVNIKLIMDEFKIPKEILEEKEDKEEINSNINSLKDIEEEKFDFDNDIQPKMTISHEMKIIIYLSKPKVIVFDGKFGLLYISPTPLGKDEGYYLIVKNPENMKFFFKIKILEIITCVRKNDKAIFIQNFVNKSFNKANHELNFKNEDECSSVYQGINFLMNYKEDGIYY